MKMLDVEKLKEYIEEIATHDLKNNKVFGSGYLVMQGEEVVYKKYFGYASTDGKTLGDHTTFRLASMTKPITAIAILILAERGMLSLDDEISKFIPEYKTVAITKTEDSELLNLGEARMPITIRHLLTHTSGIGSSDSGKNAFLTAEDKKTALRLSKRFAQLGVDFEPGSTQFYSGVASFAALGAIIEQVSGQSLQDFYTKEIFVPCGMENTTFIPTKEQWSTIIDMHGRNEDGSNIAVPMQEGCIFGEFPCEHCVAGAGLVSTLADYTKFATMLLNKGKALAGRIVREDIFKEMSTPQVKIDPMTYWGFGVRVIGEGHPYLPQGAFGWSGAYGSHFWVDVENQIVAVFMKNSTVDGGAGNASSRNFESAVKRSLL
jgi:CubicO group peptidase (beta-lactamase class C family)